MVGVLEAAHSALHERLTVWMVLVCLLIFTVGLCRCVYRVPAAAVLLRWL